MSVRQLRLVVTADDYEAALVFYRDVLGLAELGSFTGEQGAVTILDAGRATLELTDASHAEYIDEVEVGRRVAGHIRVALEVDAADLATRRLESAGATVLAEPVETPWGSRNSRLEAPAGLQLTLFEEPAGDEPEPPLVGQPREPDGLRHARRRPERRGLRPAHGARTRPRG